MNNFTILIEQDEDGYFVSEVVELPGCHTQAKSLDELMERTKEAIRLYLSCLTQEQKEELKEKFIGIQHIKV
jgi:predicted RNase H-like HicB family nuclease